MRQRWAIMIAAILGCATSSAVQGQATTTDSIVAARWGTLTAWKITEDKSPVDDSPQITAMLNDEADDGALMLRCRERKTEAVFTKLKYLGHQRIKVFIRLNEGKATETAWNPAGNGQGVFAPNAVQFIRSLPDSGRLFIRAVAFDGSTSDGTFVHQQDMTVSICVVCFAPKSGVG